MNATSRARRLCVVVGLCLCAGPARAAQEPPTPTARLDALVQEYRQAELAYIERIRAAETDDERARAYAGRPGPVFAPRFQSLAGEFEGTQVAAAAWIWVFRLVQQQGEIESARKTLAKLLEDYIESPALDELPDELGWDFRLGQATCVAALEQLIERSPHARVRSGALVNLGALLMSSEPETARALFERVLAEFGDSGRHAERARGSLFELDHLQLGMLAPEIEGQDVDSQAFKLSDYRGKVVVLAFWGHWCNWCRAMYAHERALVKRLANEPFALIGVNSDVDRTSLREVLAAEQITWRNFWDGPQGTKGPIARRWNVTSWPTIYVLDATGKIRFRDVRGPALDQAVDALLAEGR
jgi:thiol-disulfide isomerase/thioredoxin